MHFGARSASDKKKRVLASSKKLQAVIAKLDSKRASATVPADDAMIKKKIVDEFGGHEDFDLRLRDTLTGAFNGYVSHAELVKTCQMVLGDVNPAVREHAAYYFKNALMKAGQRVLPPDKMDVGGPYPSLDWRWMDLDAEQAAGVVQMLKRGVKITKLNVDGTELDVPKLLDTIVTGNGAHLLLPGLGPASAVIFADILAPPVFEGARTLKSLDTRSGPWSGSEGGALNGTAAHKLATAVLRTESLEKFSDIPIKKLREDQLKGLSESPINDGKLKMEKDFYLGPVEGIVLGELIKGRVDKGLVFPPLATLKELMLNGNQLGVDGGKALGHALKKNQVIEKLQLASNELTRKGEDASAIQAIAAGIKKSPSLTELDLSSNILQPAGCTKALGAALAANPKLKKLKLESCGMGPPGIAQIAEGAGKNHVLVDLNLKGNHLVEWRYVETTEGLAALAKATLENGSLEHLHLGYDLDHFKSLKSKNKGKSALETAAKELAKNIGDKKSLRLH